MNNLEENIKEIVYNFLNDNIEFYNDEDHYEMDEINTTSAIDEISFKMASGNIDAGKIKMYGIK